MNIFRVIKGIVRPSKAAEELRERCIGAIQALGDKALEARVSVHDSPPMVAWGLALDHPATNTQTGIFGTAASLGVLAISGQLSQVADDAERAMNEWFPDPNGRYRAKGDFENIFKVSAYVGGLQTGDRLIASPNLFAEWLVLAQLPASGWGCYHNSSSDRDATPQVEPTARALIALGRYQPYLGSNEAKSALEWLCGAVKSLRTVEPSIRALGLYALVSFPGARGLVGADIYDKAVRQASEQLHRPFTDWDGKLTLYKHDYVVRRSGHNEPKYIDTAREVIVALALLTAEYAPARDFVTRCVIEVVQQVETHRAVRPTSLLYTSQQLWAARLLGVASQAASPWLEGPEEAALRRHPVLFRLVVLVILLAGAIPLTALTLGDWPNGLHQQLLNGSLLVVQIVCAAGVVALVGQLLRRRW